MVIFHSYVSLPEGKSSGSWRQLLNMDRSLIFFSGPRSWLNPTSVTFECQSLEGVCGWLSRRANTGGGLGRAWGLPAHFQVIFVKSFLRKLTASCSGIKLCYKICSSKTRIPDIEISAKFKPLTRPECDWWVVFGKNPNPNFMKSHG